jgi:membrane protein
MPEGRGFMLRRNLRRLRARARPALLRLEVAWEVFADGSVNYYRNGAFNQAAAIALYAFLSIIPLFILSVLAASTILGAHRDIQNQMVAAIRGIHPYFNRDLLDQLGAIQEKARLLGWLGFVSLVWFSSWIFGAIETALDVTFRSESPRNILVSKLLAFAMIPLGWVTGLTSVLLTYATSLLSAQASSAALIRIQLPSRFMLQYLVPFVVLALFITIVFLVIPSRRIRLGTAVAGSCLFSFLVEAVKHAFTWYVTNHTRYHAIFGSLETVVILVIWVYYMALIFLFCAELMSSYERRDMLLVEHVLMNRAPKGGHQRLFRKFGRCYREGAVICREGDLSQDMFFVLSGRVRLETRSGASGKVLAELVPGSYFGEMAALTGSPRAATALAATDCDVAVIDGQVLHRLLRESDDLSIHMLKEFCERIRRTNQALDLQAWSWNRLRAAFHLLELWPWPADRNLAQELAALLGRTQEEVRDILASLQAEGVLQAGETGAPVLDPARAKAFVRDLVVRP